MCEYIIENSFKPLGPWFLQMENFNYSAESGIAELLQIIYDAFDPEFIMKIWIS